MACPLGILFLIALVTVGKRFDFSNEETEAREMPGYPSLLVRLKVKKRKNLTIPLPEVPGVIAVTMWINYQMLPYGAAGSPSKLQNLIKRH